MAVLALRGEPIGQLDAVLFDKDGTLSHSEPLLTSLARTRIDLCEARVAPERRLELRELLERAYGLTGDRLHPAGTTAVASRSHNLISTATVFCLVGLGWPEALRHSEEVFFCTDAAPGEDQAAAVALPTQGLERLLAELDTAGVVIGVISNDQPTGIERFLRAHQLQHHIRGIWSADHKPAKPDPGAVHGFCRQLGVEPAACALIGDADSDLSMAEAAGVAVALGYLSGWLTPPALDARYPRIHHWSELTVLEAPGTNGSAT